MRIEPEGARISLMSPEKTLRLSAGEVLNARTLHVLRETPEKGGLFCQKIFGPVDYGMCACKKYHPWYKKSKITCQVCGVTIEDPKVRRERSGHIALVSPVVHIWYRKIIATLLAIPPKKLDQLIECAAHMVIKRGLSDYKVNEIIPTRAYLEYKEDFAEDKAFVATSGGTLIKELLTNLNLEKLVKQLKEEEPSVRVNKRLTIAQKFLKSKISPSWMVMDNILVLPPDLRPLLVMDDGTMASSDLNDLYAKIIHRNTRLKKLYEMKAPYNLLNIGKAQVQMSVDALIENGKKVSLKDRKNKRVLKSLSSIIEKKTGRLRKNLLGKRVDYSGRSVIVVGPDLKLNQVGLPLDLALDLFKPFVYGRLRKRGYAASLKQARAMLEAKNPTAIDALEYEMAERVVLLNRAPSLHRMSIQAFYPVIVDGRAIRLHPLTCSAFNADFDGDQMGVHLPITMEAQIESQVLMLSINNILSPASGKISTLPSQDIVLGLYFLTKERAGLPGEGKYFADTDDALMALDSDIIELQTLIKVRIGDELTDTTAGRIIFSNIMPPGVPFPMLNKTFGKKDLGKIVNHCYEQFGQAETVVLLDKLKATGYKYATISGISLCIDDMTIPKAKKTIIQQADERVREIKSEYDVGVISAGEKHNKIVDTWIAAKEAIADAMMENFGASEDTVMTDEERLDRKEFNSLFMMASSGARGDKNQISQAAGMRGLMAKPTGEIVEIPIKSNLREGLTYHEYLLACHGARKGRADGALKTANAGYFTRRLVDTAHNVVINDVDCRCIAGLEVEPLLENDDIVIPLAERIIGRTSMKTIKDPDGKVLVKKNALISKEAAQTIEDMGISKVMIRSPYTCKLKSGVCAYCYGIDLSTKELPEIGQAVGIIAAQSVGEPGTQLTLRTFHSGGSASGGNVKNSLKAKESGELVLVDTETVTNNEGKQIAINRNGKAHIKTERGVLKFAGSIRYGSTLNFEHGAHINKGDKIIEWDPSSTPLLSVNGGTVTYADIKEGLTIKREADGENGIIQSFVSAILKDMVPKILVDDKEYFLPIGAMIAVNEHDQISPGTVLSKVPTQAAKNADITGGLARVLQVLEARKLTDPAILADIDGEIVFNAPQGKYTSLDIRGPEISKTYIFPIEKQVTVYNGDTVKAGDILVEGTIALTDLLRILGPDKTAIHIIDEVQKVYRSQGVEIADKHLEIIAKKMLGKVRITNAGDTEMVVGDFVSKHIFLDANKAIKGKQANAEAAVLSLTKASQMADGWLSAASFQNTTTILANAAIQNMEDYLEGSKENILLGNMVPLGTGHKFNRQVKLQKKPQVKTVPLSRKKREAIADFLALFDKN